MSDARMKICNNTTSAGESEAICTLHRTHAGNCRFIDMWQMCTVERDCRALAAYTGRSNGEPHSHR